jgi:hypothetical protein
VFAGSGKFCNASGPLAVPTEPVGWWNKTPPAQADNRSLILFDRGDGVMIQAGEDGIRFLLVSGKPLEEPVACAGLLGADLFSFHTHLHVQHFRLSLRRQLGIESTVDPLEVPGREVRLQALPIGIAPDDFLDIEISLKRKSRLRN